MEFLKFFCAAALDFSAISFCSSSAVKDDGTVGRALVRALAVQRGRVVRLPEHVQQVGVGNFCRVKLNLRHLGVAGGLGANLFVSGIWRMPPAKPLVTEMTPGSRSKTASMHQKQPPPRSAISTLFVSVVFIMLVGEPASAVKLSVAMAGKRQIIDFMSLRNLP